ncbi:hypothetical protein, partial [Rhodococcus jostii]|uniref:hypothetical protein n=1 Tax=Rhodococcus jostii TaxID=132919 RepID=UPI003654C3F9
GSEPSCAGRTHDCGGAARSSLAEPPEEHDRSGYNVKGSQRNQGAREGCGDEDVHAAPPM